MQQSCTYGSVRGAPGQPAFLPRQSSNAVLLQATQWRGARRSISRGVLVYVEAKSVERHDRCVKTLLMVREPHPERVVELAKLSI
jgi:hypothetical protein